jgi:hypothetical protein
MTRIYAVEHYNAKLSLQDRESAIRKDERDKILDILDAYADGLPPYSGKDMPKVMLKLKIKELRR